VRAPRAAAVLATAAAVSFAAGRLSARRSDGAAESATRRVLYYQDPMHPAYRSRSPGLAPDCGMRLEPVYAPSAEAPADAGLRGGSLVVSPERQQRMGLRFATVRRGSGTRTLRTIGRLVPDESRVHRVSIGVEGWVTRVETAGSTGSWVRRGQPLASVASRDLLAPQQAYVYALQSLDEVRAKPSAEKQRALVESQLLQARQALEATGMGPPQMRELARTRTPAEELRITSPADGIVLSRSLELGQRYDRPAELARIASLDRVWVLADVSPQDVALLKPGTSAQVGLSGQPRLLARVSAVPPQFDAGSRTFKVRLLARNPEARLRPEMLLDVDLELQLPEGVVVDRDAVVDSGLRQTIFVDRGGGRLEPRRVRTGWRSADLVEILEGAAPGERVVVSGQFLLDSESALRSSLASWSAERAVDPACGMEVETARAAATREEGGRRYYFCSDACLRRFEADRRRR